MFQNIRSIFRNPFAYRPPPETARDLAGDEEARYRPIEWPLVRRLVSFLAPYKKQYSIGIVFGIAMVSLEMLSPRFIGAIVDYTTAYAAGRYPTISQSSAITHVISIVLLWAAVLAAAMLLQRRSIIIMTRAGESVQFDLRRHMFAHLQRLSMSFYDRTKLGRIISRCTSDISSLREVNVWGIDKIVKNSLMITIAAAMLLYTEPRLFLSVVWLGPVLFIANYIYRRRAADGWQVVREGFTRVSTNLAENITGVRVVTAFNRQSPNLGVFNGLQEVNTSNNVVLSRVNGIYQPLLNLIGFVGRVIILLFGGYLIASGRVRNVGAVVAAFLYWDWFMNPIIDFGTFSNLLLQAMAGAERIFSLLDTAPDVQDLPDARPLPRINGEVKFQNVTFGYNPDRPILHGINFTAEPGQMVALVGATGSGKSSIISLIARFYQPQKGQITVDGHDLRHITGESLHRQTGLVLQVNYLFTGTVMENVRYAKPSASDDDVINAAKSIGSYDAIMNLKDGFKTEVGERGASMSLGQRQLICFTRAFLADPRILMLDEATSSVDTETEVLIQESLEKLLENRTTFIVAHRLSTILRADCILVIDQGKIVERGTHRQLINLDGKYAHLYDQFVQHA
ncbi:MAG TPA: ABC transporter ATP-binding protein [Tepidisphaeraceae bacterium]|jgi:ATP-binding cassette subfamily B protein|nr:ABC transporter ATP-binding protein [Tepidisphaeraceae bacterium]